MNSTTVTFSFRMYLAVLAFFCCATAFSQSNVQQSFSVNSDGSAAHASAQLDVSATDKGMLVPRMTTAQRTAIASPATGLLVFDTTTGGFWFHNGTGWTDLSVPKTLADADGDTKIQVEENPNEDIIRFDLGGTERMVLRQNASGSPRLELPNGLSNNFIGAGAGSANTSGNQNSANGISALEANTSGGSNTANGYSALYGNTTGSQNTATGVSALYSNNGSQNTATGAATMYQNTIGGSNVANGFGALYSNTTGSSNIAVGRSALQSNTTGYSNVAIGRDALFFNTNQHNLIAIGDSALYNNTIFGGNNLAIGSKAMFSNTAGGGNVSIGGFSMYWNNTGVENTATGNGSLYNNTSGLKNTSVGYSALFSNTNGTNNTALGHKALLSNMTGSNNTAIGMEAYFNTVALSNTTCLGYFSGGNVNASNRIEIGNTSVSFIGGQVNWGTYSDARIKTQVQENVPGLAFITKLRPVTYHLDIHKQNDLCFKGKKDIGEWEGMYDIEQKQMTGFIAQEVEAAAKASGFDFSGVEKGADEVGLYSVKYAEFVVPLVKAVQELEAENAALKAELHANKSQLDKITAALQAMGVELR